MPPKKDASEHSSQSRVGSRSPSPSFKEVEKLYKQLIDNFHLINELRRMHHHRKSVRIHIAADLFSKVISTVKLAFFYLSLVLLRHDKQTLNQAEKEKQEVEVDNALDIIRLILRFSALLPTVDESGRLVETTDSVNLEKQLQSFFDKFIHEQFEKTPNVFFKLMSSVLFKETPVLAFKIANYLLPILAKKPDYLSHLFVRMAYNDLIAHAESKAVLSSSDLGPMFFNLHTWVREWLQLVVNYDKALSRMSADATREPLISDSKLAVELFHATLENHGCPSEAAMSSMLFEPDFKFIRYRYTANYFALDLLPQMQKKPPYYRFFKICFWIYDAIFCNQLSEPLERFAKVERCPSECIDPEFQKLLTEASPDALQFCFLLTRAAVFPEGEEILLTDDKAQAFLKAFKEQLACIVRPTTRPSGVFAIQLQAIPAPEAILYSFKTDLQTSATATNATKQAGGTVETASAIQANEWNESPLKGGRRAQSQARPLSI